MRLLLLAALRTGLGSVAELGGTAAPQESPARRSGHADAQAQGGKLSAGKIGQDLSPTQGQSANLAKSPVDGREAGSL